MMPPLFYLLLLLALFTLTQDYTIWPNKWQFVLGSNAIDSRPKLNELTNTSNKTFLQLLNHSTPSSPLYRRLPHKLYTSSENSRVSSDLGGFAGRQLPKSVHLPSPLSANAVSTASQPAGLSLQKLVQIPAPVTLPTIDKSSVNAHSSINYNSHNHKICVGTNVRLSVPFNKQHHFQNLKDRFTNCTYVDGNLEITWLQSNFYDLSFLQSIREVTGYVLIAYVDVERVSLPNLQIIRGRELFKLNMENGTFSVLVIDSKMRNLEMPGLREILSGDVGFFSNQNLCHMQSLLWEEMLGDPLAKVTHKINNPDTKNTCPPCHPSCQNCWSGAGPHMCQVFTKHYCSPQCLSGGGRCFGLNPRECCHSFCAGGCTGPKQSDCYACKTFYDEGECKQECPPMMHYNPSTYAWETNPFGKYAYGATCVKNCPDHLLRDNGACVRSCPPNKRNVGGECVPCIGPCPKNCQGVETVHADNIESFRGCTVIEGSISILDQSFIGYTEASTNGSSIHLGPTHPPMPPERLEVFNTLREITGFLNIQANHPGFKNLSFFRNLQYIGGRQTTDMFAALYIVKTSLVSLNLRSLKKIRAGNVGVIENSDLCFAEKVDWRQVLQNTGHFSVKNNGNADKCLEQSLVCHGQCATDGCWGRGSDECLSCLNFKLDDHCVKDCNSTMNVSAYDAGNKTCERCHDECLGGCNGTGSNNCVRCKNVKDGPFCVKECPISKYNHNGICQPCHKACEGGCTGPNNTIGKDGCKSCDKAIPMDNDSNAIKMCLRADEPCPSGYFLDYAGPDEKSSRSICRKCHHRCKNCSAMGFHVSVCECARYSAGEQCEDQCSRDHYADEANKRCIGCHPACNSCIGPADTDCLACRLFKVHVDLESNDANSTIVHSEKFKCTPECPPEKPYRIYGERNRDPYCSDRDPNPNPTEVPEGNHIGRSVMIIVVLIGFAVPVVLYCAHASVRAARSREKTAKLAMKLGGFEDNEPLNPSNIPPNLSQLRIIKEADLRRGSQLGKGFGGTVYQGVWIPEGENVKMPVAIKVLKDSAPSRESRKAFEEEVYIMASVNHPHVLKLIAVCMTSEVMLVTQLMPLGNLLDYVKANRHFIGSKPLLNWCTQIARGMAYLESKRMVHRDLALRNVLVKTPGEVVITDFGLAKFLDVNEEEYKGILGPMPIRWLAPECIKDKIFTHQSDVWAFGVSVWELLTYGKCPYENCQDPQNLGQLLDKGERLPHPKYASLDVYMVMWRCWYNDPKARPSFHELSDTFAKYARDPGRYLAIPGDKLMKLPFYSPQDEHNLFKAQGVPIEGGPEKVVAAEDYLHLRSSDTPVPLTPCNKFIKDRGFDLEHGDDSPVPKYAPVTLLDQDNDFSAPDNDTVGDANNNSRLYERKKLDTLNVGATDIPGQYDNMDYHGSDAMSQNLSGILNKFQLDSNAMDASVPLTPCNKFIQDHDFDIDDDNYLLPSPGPHFNGYPHFSNGSRVFEWPEVCQSNVRTLDNLEYLLTANNYNYLNHNINNQPQLLPGNAVKPEEGQKRYRAKFRQICRNHQAIKLKDHNNLNNSEEMAQLTLHTGMSSLDSQMNTPLTPSCPNTPRLNLVTDVAPLRLSHSSSNSSQSFDEKMTYNSDDQTSGSQLLHSLKPDETAV